MMLLYSSGRQPVDRDRLVDLYHCPVAPFSVLQASVFLNPTALFIFNEVTNQIKEEHP